MREGQRGFCYIRRNLGGRLLQLGYGHPVAVQVDPIEKKPLNHFLPGTTILSLGTAGCNLGCRYCQNWDISQARAHQITATELPPEEVVKLAVRQGTPSIAFTYNEPTIWSEYVVDIARLAHERGISTVMVTNGYISHAAFRDVYEHIDAANVDLKSIREAFYAKSTLGHVAPVLETLRWLRRETAVWFEITNLIIPKLNDDPAELQQLCQWVLDHLGDDVPLHFSAFHPQFKLLDVPPTPAATLHRAREIAMHIGLKYVYEGNVYSDGGNTICPGCKRTIVRRSWHDLTSFHMDEGKCAYCSKPIAGVFSSEQVEARRKHA